jgi:hypothetical protein
MQQIIGLKDLKQNPDAYAKKVHQGHSFIVVKQSKPMFRISSPVIPDVREIDLDEEDGKGWKTVIDFTKIRKGGVPVEEVVKSIENLKKHEQSRQGHRKATKRI